jgi:hypothetical protein
LLNDGRWTSWCRCSATTMRYIYSLGHISIPPFPASILRDPPCKMSRNIVNSLTNVTFRGAIPNNTAIIANIWKNITSNWKPGTVSFDCVKQKGFLFESFFIVSNAVLLVIIR